MRTDTTTVAYRVWICGVCFDELDDHGDHLSCPSCGTAFTRSDDDHAPAGDATLDANAIREWRCGLCGSGTEPYGNSGDRSCTSCGRMFRPGGDGFTATRIPSDDDVLVRYDG